MFFKKEEKKFNAFKVILIVFGVIVAVAAALAIACKLLKKYFTFNISCNCCEDCEDFNCDECECGNYLDDIDFSDLDVEVEDVADDAE